MDSTIQAEFDGAAKPGIVTHAPHKDDEIGLYSHSDVFYWWPVWALGFVLAFVTYLDGGCLAVVPTGTMARRDWRVEIGPGNVETREGLILPQTTAARDYHLPPAGWIKTTIDLAAPEQPRVRVAHNPYLGPLFLITILVVFVSTHAPLRGLRRWQARRQSRSFR